MMSIDQSKPALIVLLDLSAAFDTVEHNVLFSRLKDMFGLSGKVIEWFRSYLEQRSQRVSVHGIISDIQLFLILCTREFSSWSSGFSNIYPSSLAHCKAIWP